VTVSDTSGNVVGTAQIEAGGRWSLETPVGIRSQQILVSAVNAAGVVSNARTAWLDTDRPDAAGIDRATTAEVSGEVGAAESLSTVTVVFPDGRTASTRAAANGSYRVATPQGMALGTVTVTVTDAAGNVSDSTTATLTAPVAKMTVTPRYAQINAGQTQTITGSGFRPKEWVSVRLCATCSVRDLYRADAAGKVTLTYLVSSTTEPGTVTAIVTGVESGSVTTTYEVVAPQPTTATTSWWSTFLSWYWKYISRW